MAELTKPKMEHKVKKARGNRHMAPAKKAVVNLLKEMTMEELSVEYDRITGCPIDVEPKKAMLNLINDEASRRADCAKWKNRNVKTT